MIVVSVHRSLILAAVLLIACGGGRAAAQYAPPKFDQPAIDHQRVDLMEDERARYATNLAGFVANELRVTNAYRAEWARKLLGLALHLDQRNRAALVANHQLARGISPKKVAADYAPDVFARLLVEKSKSMRARGGDENVFVAGLLLAAAVEMDPANEDAVYELEIYKLDVGAVDWAPITDGRPRKPAVPAPAEATPPGSP